MSDLLITYHVEDSLPDEAVALVEATDETIDVYLSGAHSRETVAAVLGPLMTTYCAINHVEQHIPKPPGAEINECCPVPFPRAAQARRWPRLIAAAAAPLAACAWLCELFLRAAAPVLGA